MTQTQQTTHTPTPWALSESHNKQWCIVMGQNGHVVSIPKEHNEVNEANAAFIITACNQHEALLSEVKALREALEELVNSPNAKQNACWDRARAALSLSQVKP